MRSISLMLGLFIAAAVSSLANAQATRTWVSGVGDDANPCSRTAPCKTFAGAISKTAAGGEINCLDPGGFGAVTITKSMAIICEGVTGSILASGTNGVIVNDSATATPGTIVVYLSGLDIEGAGTGINGINFVRGAALNVRNTIIRGFQSLDGTGIKVAPSTGASEVFLEDLTVSENGTATAGFGILIAPTGTGTVSGALNRVTVKNGGGGLRADAAGTTGSVSLAIRDSTASGNNRAGFAVVSNGATSRVLLDGCSTAGNGNGVSTQGNGSALFLTRTSVVFNQNGLVVQGGTISSYGDNQIDNNTIDGPAPSTITHK